NSRVWLSACGVYRSLNHSGRYILSYRTEEYGLSDRQLAGASDRAIDSRAILVHTNDRLHHFRRNTCGIGIKIHHRAAFVAHGDGDGGRVVPVAERKHTA